MPGTGTANILLVDDQPQKLLAYEAILEPLGQKLLRAGSGSEALEILLKTDIAVILLDVVMPGMDGFETARMVRFHPRFRRTPIIFVTAISTSDMEQLRGYELGAVDYVYVPVVPEILRAKVAVFVDLYQKSCELQSLNRELENRVLERTAELKNALAALEEHTSKLEEEIAQRKRLEWELRQQADQLADADRRKDEFLAMLAHELRNPLAPIRTVVESMRLRPQSDPVLIRGRQIVENQVAHMVKLLDDLLDVSRITGGKIRIVKKRVELSNLIAQAIETVQPMIRDKHHHLEVRIPSDLVEVDADPTRLVQILANLLNNAAKYTEPGGEIHLSAQQDGSEIVIRLRDSGIGIAADMLPHVFDLFAQADRTLERSQGGLGIGLTLVHKLVELHGGTVVARSEGLGKGSEFVVRLPALPFAPLSPAILEPGEPPGMETSASAEPPRRILVVDDSVDVAESLGMLLEMLGHEVHMVHGGREAIDAVARVRPHVVLLDIGLPGMDGYEVARTIRQHPAVNGVRLIAISGYGQDQDLARSKAAGFDLHLVKPVSVESLQAAIASLEIASAAHA